MPVLGSQRHARMRAWGPVGAGELGAMSGWELGLAMLGSRGYTGVGARALPELGAQGHARTRAMLRPQAWGCAMPGSQDTTELWHGH